MKTTFFMLAPFLDSRTLFEDGETEVDWDKAFGMGLDSSGFSFCKEVSENLEHTKEQIWNILVRITSDKTRGVLYQAEDGTKKVIKFDEGNQHNESPLELEQKRLADILWNRLNNENIAHYIMSQGLSWKGDTLGFETWISDFGPFSNLTEDQKREFTTLMNNKTLSTDYIAKLILGDNQLARIGQSKTNVLVKEGETYNVYKDEDSYTGITDANTWCKVFLREYANNISSVPDFIWRRLLETLDVDNIEEIPRGKAISFRVFFNETIKPLINKASDQGFSSVFGDLSGVAQVEFLIGLNNYLHENKDTVGLSEFEFELIELPDVSDYTCPDILEGKSFVRFDAVWQSKNNQNKKNLSEEVNTKHFVWSALMEREVEGVYYWKVGSHRIIVNEPTNKVLQSYNASDSDALLALSWGLDSSVDFAGFEVPHFVGFCRDLQRSLEAYESAIVEYLRVDSTKNNKNQREWLAGLIKKQAKFEILKSYKPGVNLRQALLDRQNRLQAVTLDCFLVGMRTYMENNKIALLGVSNINNIMKKHSEYFVSVSLPGKEYPSLKVVSTLTAVRA